MALWPIGEAGLEFARDLMEQERLDRAAPPEPEEIVLTRRLCRAMHVDTIKAKLVALRVLTKCIRDGSVTRAELAELRDNPLPEPEVPPGSTKLL